MALYLWPHTVANYHLLQELHLCIWQHLKYVSKRMLQDICLMGITEFAR